MNFGASSRNLVGLVSRSIFAAVTLVAAQAASAHTLVNNGGVGSGDAALMLLSGIGLMVFVARHRGKGGRDKDR